MAAVIGSDIMGEWLARGNVDVALLANKIASVQPEHQMRDDDDRSGNSSRTLHKHINR